MFQLDREFLARPSKGPGPSSRMSMSCAVYVMLQRTRPALRRHSSIPCRDSCEPKGISAEKEMLSQKKGEHLKNNHGVACWDGRAKTPKGKMEEEEQTGKRSMRERDGTVLIKTKVMMWVVLVLSDPMSENARDACQRTSKTLYTSAYILCRSSSCFLDKRTSLQFTHFII